MGIRTERSLYIIFKKAHKAFFGGVIEIRELGPYHFRTREAHHLLQKDPNNARRIPFSIAMEAVSIEGPNTIAPGAVHHSCDDCVPSIEWDANEGVPFLKRTANH